MGYTPLVSIRPFVAGLTNSRQREAIVAINTGMLSYLGLIYFGATIWASGAMDKKFNLSPIFKS